MSCSPFFFFPFSLLPICRNFTKASRRLQDEVTMKLSTTLLVALASTALAAPILIVPDTTDSSIPNPSTTNHLAKRYDGARQPHHAYIVISADDFSGSEATSDSSAPAVGPQEGHRVHFPGADGGFIDNQGDIIGAAMDTSDGLAPLIVGETVMDGGHGGKEEGGDEVSRSPATQFGRCMVLWGGSVFVGLVFFSQVCANYSPAEQHTQTPIAASTETTAPNGYAAITPSAHGDANIAAPTTANDIGAVPEPACKQRTSNWRSDDGESVGDGEVVGLGWEGERYALVARKLVPWSTPDSPTSADWKVEGVVEGQHKVEGGRLAAPDVGHWIGVDSVLLLGKRIPAGCHWKWCDGIAKIAQVVSKGMETWYNKFGSCHWKWC